MRYRTYAHMKKCDSSYRELVTLLQMEPVEEKLISKKKTVSAAWTIFGLKPSSVDHRLHNSTAICHLCKRSVSAKGGRNTSNLFSHLRHKYPSQFSEIKATPGTSTSSKQSSSQQNIDESFASGQKYARDNKRWQQLTDSVCYAIAKDMMPLSYVETPGFEKMLSMFDSKYKMPSRKYISQTAIPTLYNSTTEKVETELCFICLPNNY